MARWDISLTGAPANSTMGLPVWKRVLDLTIILVLAPALLIIGVAVALVVMCGSRGPVFFRQRRIGYKGREFGCFKFRTMHVDAESRPHREHLRHLISTEAPMTKLDLQHDPRLAPLGSVLRATGLDELPQFINVIRGEMSLVGPRPCIPYELELYQPWQRRRLDAVPGLTGLWQVSGKNQHTFNEMVCLDIEYTERMSLWRDLRIILKTVPALWNQCRDFRLRQRKQAVAVPSNASKPLELYHL